MIFSKKRTTGPSPIRMPPLGQYQLRRASGKNGAASPCASRPQPNSTFALRGASSHTDRSMKGFKEGDFPVDMIRRFLKSGPIVLVSSDWHGKTNIDDRGPAQGHRMAATMVKASQIEERCANMNVKLSTGAS